jgi:type 1 fimbria pilin
MKKVILFVLISISASFISAPFAKVLPPDEEAARIINSKNYFSGIKKPCQSKATKFEADVNLPQGGGAEVSSSQVNNAWDCGAGKDFSCQIIDCSKRTLVIFVHAD